MLSAAQSPSTPEYAQVHEFIRIRQARKSFALSLRSLRDPPPPKPSSAPNPNTIPLLTRVSGPNEPPRYEPTVRPRPLSELGGTGIRRVPVLELAAGIPYLRQTKPQTLIMNRIIRQKSDVLQEKVTEAMDLLEHPLEAAKWEDAWDTIVEKEAGQYRDRDPPGLFRESTQKSMNFVFDRLADMRVDSHARGSALQKLVQDERALRDQERIERREQRRREREARKAAGGESVPAAEPSPGGANVGVTPQTASIRGEAESPESSIEIARRLASQVAQSDPFIDPARAEVLDATKEADMTGKETPSSNISPATTKTRTKKFTAIKRIAGDSTLGSTSALGRKEPESEPGPERMRNQARDSGSPGQGKW